MRFEDTVIIYLLGSLYIKQFKGCFRAGARGRLGVADDKTAYLLS